MDQEPDRGIDEFEGQMEEADSLIKSLEEEVESLRADLDQASVALRTARQEISAREQALEEYYLARKEAERQARSVQDAMGDLRIQNSDEQLQLRNQHIAELARMQDRFGAQRISGMERTFRGGDAEALKEEYRGNLRDLQQRYQREMEALENSYEEWKDRLLEDERARKERHEADLQELRKDSEEQRKELRRQLREEYERNLEESRQDAIFRHGEGIRALNEGFEKRVQQLQGERESLAGEHRAELEAAREQADRELQEADEKRKNDLREIKTFAENRERELRRAQSVKVRETAEEAERRIASLQAQRKADNEALNSRHEKEISRLQQGYDERLNAEAGRRRQEVVSLEEQLESVKLERASEARAYINRLKDFEIPALVPQNGHAAPESGLPETDAEDNLQEIHEAEMSSLRGRVSGLEEALTDSQNEAAHLAEELEMKQSETIAATSETGISEDASGHIDDLTEQIAIPDPEAAEDDSNDKSHGLEIQLRKAEEERRHYADELGKALDKLRRLSDPEHRLRAGISAFNESHHTRNVASISKALGLPGVHAGIEEDPSGKPTFTFVWEDISWRRYIAEPIEGLEEPRVYLIASGDDPEQTPPPDDKPNARVDARGRLILGVQER